MIVFSSTTYIKQGALACNRNFSQYYKDTKECIMLFYGPTIIWIKRQPYNIFKDWVKISGFISEIGDILYSTFYLIFKIICQAPYLKFSVYMISYLKFYVCQAARVRMWRYESLLVRTNIMMWSFIESGCKKYSVPWNSLVSFWLKFDIPYIQC